MYILYYGILRQGNPNTEQFHEADFLNLQGVKDHTPKGGLFWGLPHYRYRAILHHYDNISYHK
jgi:hypothetical protein